MQVNDGRTMRYRVLSLRSARWLIALKAAVVAIMLIGLPLAANAAPAAAHVYLMRGVLNIFSLGMDQMANRLEQKGISASVHNHILWASVADDAAAAYKSGRIKTVILVGHSSGATVRQNAASGRQLAIFAPKYWPSWLVGFNPCMSMPISKTPYLRRSAPRG